MVRISMSEKFAKKFTESVPELNKELYPYQKRVQVIENAREVPSPRPRAAASASFVESVGQLVARHFGGFLVAVTDTNSMDPWIDAGHKAIMIPFQSFAPFRKEDLQVGDIILFDRALDNAKNVLHRIIEVQGNGGMVVTRGDNTTVLDGQVVQNKIHYVCIGVIY